MRRELLRVDLANRINMEEVSWRQKARERWLKEGDMNTRYFHCLTSYRRRCNYVEEIIIDNNSIQGNEI